MAQLEMMPPYLHHFGLPVIDYPILYIDNWGLAGTEDWCVIV